MPNPWEVTPAQARIWGERTRERRRAADREAANLFFRQIADVDRCNDLDCPCRSASHESGADEQLIENAVRNIERQLEVYAELDVGTKDSQNQ